MRRVLSAVLAIFVLLGVARAQADDLDTIISKEQPVNQPPFAKYDPNTDTWSAANYDIGKLIADAAGAKLTVVEGTWQNMIPALQAGKIDVGMAPFYTTLQRALAVWFTIPVRYDRGRALCQVWGGCSTCHSVASLQSFSSI